MTKYMTHCENCPDWTKGLELCKECFERARLDNLPAANQEKKDPNNPHFAKQTIKKLEVLEKLQLKDKTKIVEESVGLFYLLAMRFATDNHIKESVSTPKETQRGARNV